MADDLIFCDENLNLPAISLGKDSSSAWGKWQNQDFGIDLTIEPPEEIQDFLDQVNSIIQLIQAVLEVSLTGLRIAKTFLTGLIDPIKALVEAVKSLIEQIVNDIRGAGFYMTGDWWILDPSFSRFRGGYTTFEKRMIARFSDKRDPSIPKITPTTDVFGLFFYMGADFAEVDKIRAFLVRLLRFFQFDIGSVLSVSKMPVPINPGVRYVTDFGSWDRIQDSIDGNVVPEAAQITWKLNSAATDEAFIQFSPPPEGFYVYLSTIRDGIQIYYDVPSPNTISGDKGSTKAQRKSGRTKSPDGKPFTIYGGAQQLKVGPKYQLKGAFDPNTKEFKDGKRAVYGLRQKTDNFPIPIEKLIAEKDGNPVYIYQRMYYVSTVSIFDLGNIVGQSLYSNSVLNLFQAAEYTYTVNIDEVPYDGQFKFEDGEIVLDETSLTPATTVYARISSTNIDLNFPDSFEPQYSISEEDIAAPFIAGTLLETLSGKEIEVSAPTEAIQIVFPGKDSSDFLHLIETALYVLILSRSDLEVVPYSDVKGRVWVFEDHKAAFPTGLEGVGDLVGKILEGSPDEFFKKVTDIGADTDINFREELKEKVENWASKLYQQLGPDATIEADLVKQTRKDLLEWNFSEVVGQIESSILPLEPSPGIVGIDQGGKQSRNSAFLQVDLTIREAMDSQENLFGIFRNPWCSGVQMDNVEDMRTKIRMRSPGYFTRDTILSSLVGVESGSCDMSPVFLLSMENIPKNIAQRVCYLRNMFPKKVYSAAALILNTATSVEERPPQDGVWLSFRLGDVIPGFEDLFASLYNFVDLLIEGLGSIIDAIVRYIEFVEARIRDLQDFLSQLDFLLGQLGPFSLGKAAILPVKGAGLGGILNAFLSAEDKPTGADVIGDAGDDDLDPAGAVGSLVDTLLDKEDPDYLESFEEYQTMLESAASAIEGEFGSYGAGAVVLVTGSSLFNDILWEMISQSLG